MQRRKFVAAAAMAALSTAAYGHQESAARHPEEENEVYELRVYTMMRGGKVRVLQDYLKTALIPALNRMGAKKVGVFTAQGGVEPAQIYVLIPHSSFQSYATHFQELKMDKAYQTAAEAYHKVSEGDKVFERYTSELMIAFDGIPQMKTYGDGQRFFELRTYQGYSDDAVRRKVRMFDKDELDIFYDVDLNPVFFGHVVAGHSLPKLTYMLAFESMEQRGESWGKFVRDPRWGKISKLPEYANTVSKIERVYLDPMEISQI